MNSIASSESARSRHLPCADSSSDGRVVPGAYDFSSAGNVIVIHCSGEGAPEPRSLMPQSLMWALRTARFMCASKSMSFISCGGPSLPQRACSEERRR